MQQENPKTESADNREVETILRKRLSESASVVYTLLSWTLLSFETLLVIVAKPLIPIPFWGENGVVSWEYLLLSGAANFTVYLAFLLFLHRTLLSTLLRREKIRQFILAIMLNAMAVGFSFVILKTSDGSLYSNPAGNNLIYVLAFLLGVLIFTVMTEFVLGRQYLNSISPYSILLLANELRGIGQYIATVRHHKAVKNKKDLEGYLNRCVMYYTGVLVNFGVDNPNWAHLHRFIDLHKKARSSNEVSADEFVDSARWFLERTGQSSGLHAPYFNISPRSIRERINIFVVRWFDGSIGLRDSIWTFCYPSLRSTWFGGAIPVRSKTRPKVVNDNHLKKLIRAHLLEVRDFERLSAERKLFVLWLTAMLLYALIYMQFIATLNDVREASMKFLLILAPCTIALAFVLNFGLRILGGRFRRRGIDASIYGAYYSQTFWVLIPTLLLAGAIVTAPALLRFVIEWRLQLIQPIAIMISAVSLLLIFRFLRPGRVALDRFADSLLVREITLLLQNINVAQDLKKRKEISRNVYFIKQYFKIVMKNLKTKYDSSDQKRHLDQFASAFYVSIDNINKRIRLGSGEARAQAATTAKTIIEKVLLEEFEGLIEIEDVKRRLTDYPKVSSPGTGWRLIQQIDNSWTFRAIVAFVLVIVTNIAGPILWSSIQNLSSWIQVLAR